MHFASIGGGWCNTACACKSTIGGGQCNITSGLYSSILGGYKNTASGKYSFIASGSANDTKGFANTFILGSNLSAAQANYTYVNNLSSQGLIYDATGNSNAWNNVYSYVNANSATNNYTYNSANFPKLSSSPFTYLLSTSSINTAYASNSAMGDRTYIIGGECNLIPSMGVGNWNATIISGACNYTCGLYTLVVGGIKNSATSPGLGFGGATVIGGMNNTSSGGSSTIAGGINNTASGFYSSIIGGICNNSFGNSSHIGGGICNSSSGDYSSILGGCKNNTRGFKNTFILGSNLSASQINYTYVNNLSTQGVGAFNQLNIATTIAATSGVSGIVNKMQIFDALGVSLGWIPIYNTIV